ncbi:MAG: IS66 family transposase [Anaerolineaceae bacterium]|nr:IS66 family transposase [Anaerolineaceae bacterium]MCB9100660.1 IS66 family transposase [Anaerolineales bacterium]
MDLETENERLKKEIQELRQLLKKALERIEQLEAQVGQNSRNSNWPSSRDKGGIKKRKQNLRQKSDKKTGGQPGHEGHTLKFSEVPNKVEHHRPERCTHCKHRFGAEQTASGLKRRQVIDLPPLKVEVTEHQVESLLCQECGQVSVGQFPEGVTQLVQYGPGIKALAVYLKGHQLLPYGRTQQFLADLFGLSVTQASLENFMKAAAVKVAPVNEKIKSGVTAAKVAHYDESGFYIGGKRQWLHSASTTNLTYYAPHPSRGNKALKAIGIMPHFSGVAVHDNWSAYWQYDQCQHALCNVHHLRELNAIAENFSQLWATRFKIFLLSAKVAVEQAKAAGKQALAHLKLEQINRLYTKLVAAALRANPPPPEGWPKGSRGRPQKTKPRNLAERFALRRDAILAFVFDFKVPFDNNLAERDIRMLKVQQKISGCFRSPGGAQTFCAIRSYISTIRKQHFSVWSALNSLFSDPILQPAYSPG